MAAAATAPAALTQARPAAALQILPILRILPPCQRPRWQARPPRQLSAVPIVPLSSVDRILVDANEYDMDAVILLNKMDLEGSEELFNDLKRYERMGYKLLKVSVKTKEGLEEFRDTLKDKCSVFVGQSGIGKSSLVNTLLPDADYKAKIGALVRSANLGAHTTSSARLFHLPGGGRIIDSPGKIRAR